MKHETLVIAEAGVNHNGSLKLAKKLVDVAEFAGADYVKFQTFKADLLVSKGAEKAEYQKTDSNDSESQYEMIKKLELNYEEFKELFDYCKLKKVKFLSTAFDLPSVDFLVELGIDFFKIPSGEITNLPYLRKIAETGLPVIISTGMADMEEVKDAVSVFLDKGLTRADITVLHCNTEYPTPMEDVNLNVLSRMRSELGLEIGYSDHTSGDEVSVAAVALGATVIEKHFTLDKTMKGPDHLASLDPEELVHFVRKIRNIDRALGGDVKEPTPSEKRNLVVARKSIVAKVAIEEGKIFNDENLTVMRPGNGITPMKWDDLLGRLSTKGYEVGQLIDEEL